MSKEKCAVSPTPKLWSVVFRPSSFPDCGHGVIGMYWLSSAARGAVALLFRCTTRLNPSGPFSEVHMPDCLPRACGRGLSLFRCAPGSEAGNP